MDWNKLKQTSDYIGEAPEQGRILAYTRQKIIFESYGTIEQAAERLEGKELLELHLFDDKKEYRAAASRSRRFDKGYVDTIVAHSDDDMYCETEFLTEKWNRGKITVCNYLKYDEESGMMTVDNYRLKMGGEE